MKIFKAAVIMGILSTLCLAGDIDSLDQRKGKGKDDVPTSKIATEFGISNDSVGALGAAYPVGNGGIYKALALSQKSGLSAEEILKMKTEGKMGWGQIAKKLNLKPGEAFKSDEKLKKESEGKEAKSEAKVKKSEDKSEKSEKQADNAEQKSNNRKEH